MPSIRPKIRQLMVATAATAIVLAIGRAAGGPVAAKLASSIGLGWLVWVAVRRSRRLALAGCVAAYAGLPLGLAFRVVRRDLPLPVAGLSILLWLYPSILGSGLAWLFTKDLRAARDRAPAEEVSPSIRPKIRQLMVATAATAAVLAAGRAIAWQVAPKLALSFGLGWLACEVGRRYRRFALAGLAVAFAGLLAMAVTKSIARNDPLEFEGVILVWLYPATLGIGSSWLFVRMARLALGGDGGVEILVVVLTFAPILLLWPAPVMLIWLAISGQDLMPVPS